MDWGLTTILTFLSQVLFKHRLLFWLKSILLLWSDLIKGVNLSHTLALLSILLMRWLVLLVGVQLVFLPPQFDRVLSSGLGSQVGVQSCGHGRF